MAGVREHQGGGTMALGRATAAACTRIAMD
jgi:hypothetical protein